MRSVRPLIVSALLIAGAALAPAPGAAAAAGIPAISLSLGGGPPTSVVSVSGSGFRAGEAVDLYVGTRLVGTGSAGSSGVLAATSLTVPAATPLGTAPVIATGRASHLTAQNKFVVKTDWQQPAFSGSQQRWNRYENSLSRSTVGQLLAAWSTIDQALSPAPLTAGGFVLWPGYSSAYRQSTGGPGWYRPSLSGEAIVAGGLAFLRSNDFTVTAVDLYSGATRWTATFPSYPDRVIEAAGALYVPVANGPLTKLDALTGRSIWTVNGAVGYSLLSVAGSMVYTAGPNQFLQARNASDGRLRWTRTTAPLNGYRSPWPARSCWPGTRRESSRSMLPQVPFAGRPRSASTGWSPPRTRRFSSPTRAG